MFQNGTLWSHEEGDEEEAHCNRVEAGIGRRRDNQAVVFVDKVALFQQDFASNRLRL